MRKKNYLSSTNMITKEVDQKMQNEEPHRPQQDEKKVLKS